MITRFRSAKALLAVTATTALLGLGSFTPPSANAAADPNANVGVQTELNYISSMHDQGSIFTCQQVGNPWLVNDLETNPAGQLQSELTHVHGMTGQYPAICADDWINCDAYADHAASVVALALLYASWGGMNEFSWHEGSPLAYSPDTIAASSAQLSASQWNDLLNNPSSATHQNWQHHMDLLAGWMGQLQSSGITILWRPYHEGDGNWFWWGASPANYQALWHMQFNYLTNVKGLHNLIWVLSTPNPAYYPGANYVDIGGMDIYSSSQTDPTYGGEVGTVQSFALGQPIALTECGLVPTTSYLHQEGYVWANIWCGGWLDPGYYGSTGGSCNTLQEVQALYADPKTINLANVAIPSPSVSSNIWYNLVNQNSGQLLAVQYASSAPGAPVQQYPNNGTPDHNWSFAPLPNGSFQIINQNSGLCLAVSGMSESLGGQVTQWTNNGTIDHNWNLVPLGNGQYHIVNQNSGLMLGVAGASTANSANVVQWSDNGSSDHNWAIVPIGSPISSGHQYHIANAHSGLFLDNPGGTNVPGTFLQQFVDTYSTAQQWTLNYDGGDLWSVVNAGGGLALDDYAWSTAAGNRLDEWSYSNQAVQQWHIDPVGDGTYTIVSDVSNLNMEIGGAAINNGGEVDQWYSNGNPCQHWVFQFVQ